MTRRHFQALADAIAEIEDETTRRVAACAIARVCRSFNPRFDRERFMAACKAS